MKTPEKLENQFRIISGVRYENENGGAYAYVQILAYNRDLMRMLRPLRWAERQMEMVEAISWMLNEYLGMSFTPRHQVIFENSKFELKEIFDSIRAGLSTRVAEPELETLHRVAA
jgi:hypothetical protein